MGFFTVQNNCKICKNWERQSLQKLMFVFKVAWWKLLSNTENAGRNPRVRREFPCADSDMNFSSLESYTWSYWGYEIWKQDWIQSELLKFLTAHVEGTKRKSDRCKHIVYSSLSDKLLLWRKVAKTFSWTLSPVTSSRNESSKILALPNWQDRLTV